MKTYNFKEAIKALNSKYDHVDTYGIFLFKEESGEFHGTLNMDQKDPNESFSALTSGIFGTLIRSLHKAGITPCGIYEGLTECLYDKLEEYFSEISYNECKDCDEWECSFHEEQRKERASWKM